MFRTAVRFFAKKAKGGRDKPAGLNIGVEGETWSETMKGILKDHGPLTVSNIWVHAQDTGLKSKRHMKLVLRWMRGQNRIKLICNHIGDKRAPESKEFLYTLPPPRVEIPPRETAPNSNESNVVPSHLSEDLGLRSL